MRYKEIKEAYEDNVWNNFLSGGGAGDLLKSFGNDTASILKKFPMLKGIIKDKQDDLEIDSDQSTSSNKGNDNNPSLGPSSSSSGQPTPNIGANSSGASQRKPASSVSGSGRPSDQLINYIKAKETFSPKAFWDYKQWTNGYGTLARSRNEVIDEREADRRLRQKAQEYYDIVVRFDQAHKYGFNNSQRDALTSFILNGGPGWLKEVSDDGRRSKQQIAKAMLQYNTAGGKTLGGLVKRRRDEVAMFTAGSNMA
jgi:GH24 family phage-related lysozyme (muramidase)